MHELSLARTLVELVADHAAREGAQRVRQVGVRLGELSAFRRALCFCFDAVVRGTVCEGAELVIDEVPLRLHCRHCGATGRPRARYHFRCFACGMPASEVVSGREMQITTVELEFAEAPPPRGRRPAGAAVPGRALRSGAATSSPLPGCPRTP